MTDYFSLLGERRRPWLDPEVLKQKFLERSAGIHPDRVHALGAMERAAAQERYVELNAAFQCLREPRDRLRHLLELELGAAPKGIQRVPPELMDFSMEIGAACRQADALLVESATITSPLLKVQYFERSHERIEGLQGLQRKAVQRRDALFADLRSADTEWVTAQSSDVPEQARLLARLEELLHALGYFDRWITQLQERIVRLSA